MSYPIRPPRSYATGDSALLPVDLLNDFFHEKGKLAERIGPSSGKQTSLRIENAFLTDAVGDFTEEAHPAALGLSFPTFGHEVTTLDALLAAIASAGTASSNVVDADAPLTDFTEGCAASASRRR